MNKYPDWIMERTFGGAQVADTPGVVKDNKNWPEGAAAPAAKECCQMLSNACNDNGNTDKNVFVFLVGGAGNGKSYLAKELTNRIKGSRVSSNKRFASRSYRYSLDSGEDLVVVNDATIPPDEVLENKDYLVRDIQSSLSKGGHFLACVNRGVLATELDNVDLSNSSSEYTMATVLIEWLLGDGKVNDMTSPPDGWELKPSEEVTKGGYYSYCRIKTKSRGEIHIHVAFMDQTSLLEPIPAEVNINGESAYQPLPTSYIELAEITASTRKEKFIPACSALTAFVERVEESISGLTLPGEELDPFKNNILALAKNGNVHNLCTMLRGAEIISGSHITYRDLWGIANLAIYGPIAHGGDKFFEGYINKLQCEARSSVPYEKVKALVHLACRRTHMSIFSGRAPDFLSDTDHKQTAYAPVQAMEMLKVADPIRGLKNDVNITVKSKLALLSEEIGPGQKMAAEDKVFASVWTILDESLEKGVTELLSEDETDLEFSKRNKLLSWYGQYLFRLYAFAHGYPAYADLVSKWQYLWNRSSKKSKEPPTNVANGLGRLVFLSFSQQNQDTLLPLMSSRVIPVTKSSELRQVTLPITKADYKWMLSTNGDSIMAKLTKYSLPNEPGAELSIDFQMLREIFTQSEANGFTEGSISVEPRLERIRAKMLSMESADENARKPTFVNNGASFP